MSKIPRQCPYCKKDILIAIEDFDLVIEKNERNKD